MVGIYIIKNNINNKVYVGQSKDIQRRMLVHWWLGSTSGNNKANEYSSEYYNQIHTAMRDIGRDHFSWEVLEECSEDKLNERERYWISYYNSYKNGYNGSKGGNIYDDINTIGENNPMALLTEKDVIYIRNQFNNHVPFRMVYEEYKDKISKRGL